MFEFPNEVFDSSEVVVNFPHEVNKKVKQRNKITETIFFIVTTPFVKINYIIYLRKEQHHQEYVKIKKDTLFSVSFFVFRIQKISCLNPNLLNYFCP